MMGRSGYSDGCDGWDLIRWRGAVASAIRGQRGQAFLKEMLEALDALPQKRLIAHELIQDGEVCAIGSVGLKRGVAMETIDVEMPTKVGEAFGVPRALVSEIESINDDDFGWKEETPEERFIRRAIMKTCPDCGCAVYSRGCVNCDEPAYIAEQEALTDYYVAEQARCLGCGSRGCTNPNCGPLESQE